MDTKDEIVGLSESLKSTVSQIKNTVRQIMLAADKVQESSSQVGIMAKQTASGANQVTSSVTQLASASTEQASNISTCMANISHVNDLIQKRHKDIDNVVSLVDTAKSVAKEGEGEANDAVIQINHIKTRVISKAETINALGNSSLEIETIIDLIKNIA